jgi:hypothetical protein
VEEALRLAKAKSRQVRKIRSLPNQDEIGSNRPNLVSTFDKVASRAVQGGRAARVVRPKKLGCLSVVMGLGRVETDVF